MIPESDSGRLPRRFRWALPYLRRELPMWGRVYRWAGGSDEQLWRGAGRATVRGKVHGATLHLDLGNWSERLSFSLARYHDLPLQMALQQVLRPGDTFVDIGANLGLVTLLASHLVGPGGRVLACEPNPTLGSRLDQHVNGNHLHNVQIVAVALGREAGTAELREYGGHSGWGSLSTEGPVGAVATRAFQVPVVPGDEVLAELPAAPTVLKIDVEGHEVPVLQGLRRTLASRLPLVLLEVADAHQRRAGHSALALRHELEQYGYRGHALVARRSWFGRKLQFLPIDACRMAEVDALFVPPHGPLADRFAALVR